MDLFHHKWDKRGGRKRRKESGNAIRGYSGRGPFSHEEAAKVFTFGYIPSILKKSCWYEINYVRDNTI